MSPETPDTDPPSQVPESEGDQERIVPVIVPGNKEGSSDLPPTQELWWRGAVLALLALTPIVTYAAWDQGWLDLSPDRGASAAAEARRAQRSVRGRFDRMADSLRDAVQGYGERRSDFGKGRIGCASLGTGFERVDRQFIELSLLFREEREDLASAHASRYDQLVEDVNAVNRHYDQSGCRGGAPEP